MRMKRSPFDLADICAAVLGAAQFGLALYIVRFGPDEPVAMHFNVHGEIDRWGSRFEAAWILAALGGLTWLLHGALGLARARTIDPAAQRSLDWGRTFGLVVLTHLTGIFTALGLGLVGPEGSDGFARYVLGGVSAVLVLIGAMAGKLTPNRWAGVRTRWNFRSRLAWDKSNRLFGRICFLGGLIGLAATPLGSLPFMIALILAVGVGGGLVATFESWRVWKSDPEAIR